MNRRQDSPMSRRTWPFVLLCLVSLQTAVAGEYRPDESARAAANLIQEKGLLAHIRFLADDLLEGRGPGTRGDRLAQRYIQSQFELLGLSPAAKEGWYQEVPLVGVTTHLPPRIAFTKDGGRVELVPGRDLIGCSGRATPLVGFQDAELVFVGYGIQAPEFQWDDYKGVDLTGKVLLVMNNDPSGDPELFAGTTRLYYGRWSYKYEAAARMGAAGVIIIHTAESAGYPWQVVQTSWTGEQFQLRDEQEPKVLLEAWCRQDAVRRVLELAGQKLDDLCSAAESRSFQPVPLGITLSVVMSCDVREQHTANVLARLEGSDPELRKEYVVFTGHHDHLGVAAEQVAGVAENDRIYNGALDNATGVAALLSLARAYSRLPKPPARTLLFAAVGGEEQGLLGSRYLAEHPPTAPGNLAACLNIDGLNIWGKTKDVTIIGKGKSDLDAIVAQVAGFQGRSAEADQFPEQGSFYRSDQFSLAKIGVPGVYTHSGTQFIGRPEGWGRAKIDQWVAEHYHQPSDELNDSWDLSGAVQDVQLLFYVGLEVANRPQMPAWLPGDEFESVRNTAIERRDGASSR